MSVSAISNPIIYSPVMQPATRTPSAAFRSELQQLSKDLKSGNLSAAQQDYATLSKSGPLANSTSTNPLVEDLQAVGAALQGGNLTGALQAFTTFQHTVQQQGAQAHAREHHHHHGGANNQVAQAFNTLEQAVNAGNQSSAQSALAALQQDLQQLGFNLGTNSAGNNTTTATQAANSTTGSNLSVTV